MPSEAFKKFRQNQPPFRPGDLKLSREMLEKRFAAISPPPKDVTYESVRLNGVGAEWVHLLNAPPDRAVMYIHGGGFTLGSIVSHRHFATVIAKASGINAVSIDYRLAPENPYPAALEDCLAAYRGLLAQGIPADGIVVAGESAGGNLSLATALYLKDKGEAMPAAVVAISPCTDFLATGESYRARAGFDPMVDGLHGLIRDYCPGEDLADPYISPLYGDYHGFPPLFLQVGTDEALLDDSRMLAKKATEAGAAVKLEVWEDMGHAFAMDLGHYPEADEGVRHIGEYIKAQRDRP